MYEVKQMVLKALEGLLEGMYQANAESALCDADTGSIFDVNSVIAELGIKNGSCLLLI